MAVYEMIEGKSVCLKPATVEDAKYTYEIRQDQERTKYMHLVNGGVEGQKKWIENQRRTEGDYFFVVYSSDGLPLGTESVYDIDADTNEGEIGRAILNGNPTQNMEALILIHEFAFCSLGLKRLRVSVLAGNTASIGVTLRFGGVENHREYSDEFQCELIWFDIYQDAYLKRRGQFIRLIDRFGCR